MDWDAGYEQDAPLGLMVGAARTDRTFVEAGVTLDGALNGAPAWNWNAYLSLTHDLNRPNFEMSGSFQAAPENRFAIDAPVFAATQAQYGLGVSGQLGQVGVFGSLSGAYATDSSSFGAMVGVQYAW